MIFTIYEPQSLPYRLLNNDCSVHQGSPTNSINPLSLLLMVWPIIKQLPQHTSDLRRIYLQARQVAFLGVDPATFKLVDFDQVTQGEQVLVAVNQDVPVGFIAWWPPDNFIHSLFTDPYYIGKGVGKSLLQACLNQIGRPATLKCKSANRQALAFYYSQGWLPMHEANDSSGSYFLLSFD